MIFLRLAVSVFAVLLILFGAVWTLSPIPLGFVFIILGVLLLAAAAPAEVRWMRRRWRWFDRAMHSLEKRLPEWIAKHLRQSDYDHEDTEKTGNANTAAKRR